MVPGNVTQQLKILREIGILRARHSANIEDGGPAFAHVFLDAEDASRHGEGVVQAHRLVIDVGNRCPHVLYRVRSRSRCTGSRRRFPIWDDPERSADGEEKKDDSNAGFLHR